MMSSRKPLPTDSVPTTSDVQRERVAVEFEERVPHDDGEHFYISIKFPLVRRSGEVYAVCGISTDITARKRAETELAATKASLERLVDERTADLRQANERLTAEVAERVAAVERLQRLIDTAREGIWVLDAVGRTTFVNARLAEMLGYTPDEMIGRLFYDFMDEARREDAARNLERRRQGVAEDHDFEFRRKDGSNVWVLLATNPILDQDGTMVGALAVLTDITERKRAEQHQRLLLRELDHRVKNTLASVLALSELTLERASSLEEFRRAFDGRVQAMARTHEALSRRALEGRLLRRGRRGRAGAARGHRRLAHRDAGRDDPRGDDGDDAAGARAERARHQRAQARRAVPSRRRSDHRMECRAERRFSLELDGA